MKIGVTATAQVHLYELDDWWRENRTRVPDRVLDEFDRICELLAAHPEAGHRYRADPTYRLVPMKGTPYQVFYRVHAERDLLTIEAVWSSERGEGPDLG